MNINTIIPSIDKLKHFFLWSIFLAICLHFTSDINAYVLSIGSAILWELIQKFIQKGTNTYKEMLLDIFFGGTLPCILNLIS
jgi:hypothetical protein